MPLVRILALILALLLPILGPAASPAFALTGEGDGPALAVRAGDGRPVAEGGRVAGDDQRARFVLDLSTEVEIAAFTLADPYRVIVDLPELAFRLPKDAGREGRGLISGWRYGLFAAGRSRIVLDATAPVKIDKAFVLNAVGGQPARLVIDLVRTTPAEFELEMQRTALTREKSNEPAVAKSDRLPMHGSDRERPLVILDPGHGGIDSGTISATGAVEKDIVLTFAFELRQRLEATGKVDVKMTREDDTFVSLGDRMSFGRNHKADLFVSIHADSTKEDFVRGATVYTLSETASDKNAAELADKENASDQIAGLDIDGSEKDEVSDILLDLTRRETKNFSTAFATSLVDELSTATRMIRNPHRAAGFRVLRAPDVPSVLVEIGYLSNAQDEKLLTSEEWRSRVTGAVTEAILRFFGPKFASASNR